MRIFKRALLILSLVLTCCITACQVAYYNMRKIPAVSGRVIDAETGAPIAGADVLIKIYGYPRDPLFMIASPPKWLYAWSSLKTDSNGCFSSPSQLPSIEEYGLPIWSYLLWGPHRQIGIAVDVFTKDHITLTSESIGMEWENDAKYEANIMENKPERPISVNREKEKNEYRYTIETKKALTEKEWIQKCNSTILYCGNPSKSGEEWMFRDLMGYLKRFPEGEKAVDYYNKAWETASIGPCDVIRRMVEQGNISEEKLRTYLNRQEILICLAKGLAQPSKNKNETNYLDGLKQRKEQHECAKKYIKDNKH